MGAQSSLVSGPTSRAVSREEEEEDDEIAVLPISIYLTLTGRSSAAAWGYG